MSDLKSGRPMPENDGVTMFQFEKIVDLAYWKAIEQEFLPLGERTRQIVNKIFKRVA